MGKTEDPRAFALGSVAGHATPLGHPAAEKIEENQGKSSIWYWPADQNDALSAWLRACDAVLLAALEWGPATFAEAREAVLLTPPPGVRVQTCGCVARRLRFAGRIERVAPGLREWRLVRKAAP